MRDVPRVIFSQLASRQEAPHSERSEDNAHGFTNRLDTTVKPVTDAPNIVSDMVPTQFHPGLPRPSPAISSARAFARCSLSVVSIPINGGYFTHHTLGVVHSGANIFHFVRVQRKICLRKAHLRGASPRRLGSSRVVLASSPPWGLDRTNPQSRKSMTNLATKSLVFGPNCFSDKA